MSPTEGFIVSHHSENSSQDNGDGAKDTAVPELEIDQTVAPRPEEEIADALSAEPASGVPHSD